MIALVNVAIWARGRYFGNVGLRESEAKIRLKGAANKSDVVAVAFISVSISEWPPLPPRSARSPFPARSAVEGGMAQPHVRAASERIESTPSFGSIPARRLRPRRRRPARRQFLLAYSAGLGSADRSISSSAGVATGRGWVASSLPPTKRPKTRQIRPPRSSISVNTAGTKTSDSKVDAARPPIAAIATSASGSRRRVVLGDLGVDPAAIEPRQQPGRRRRNRLPRHKSRRSSGRRSAPRPAPPRAQPACRRRTVGRRTADRGRRRRSPSAARPRAGLSRREGHGAMRGAEAEAGERGERRRAGRDDEGGGEAADQRDGPSEGTRTRRIRSSPGKRWKNSRRRTGRAAGPWSWSPPPRRRRASSSARAAEQAADVGEDEAGGERRIKGWRPPRHWLWRSR